MGVSSMAAASDGMQLQLCVFDLRRGQQEGQELDKILFFYPTDFPFLTQLSLVGLCEGIITFTRIFSPEAACEVIEAEKHSHVFYEAEPDIWMVLVVEKSKDDGQVWRCEALRGVLKEVHSLFKMFHMSIHALLDKKPSGELARSHLHSFITDYLSDYQLGKKMQMPSFRDSLKERGTVQMLTVSREVALEVQSLITSISSCCNGCDSLILFQDLLVSTTLPPDDTANLFSYATLRLTPHALSSSTSSWSYLRKGHATPNLLNVATLDEHQSRSRDTSQGQNCQISSIPRFLQRDKWSKGKDGFLVPNFPSGEVGSFVLSTPVVWNQQNDDCKYLCVYQHKGITVVMLVPASSLANGEQGLVQVKNKFLENVAQRVTAVEQKLSRGWGGENAYHVSGYRYLLIDRDRSVSRATPAGKVTTLKKESLVYLNKLREEVDIEKGRWRRDNPHQEKELEVSIRAENNAWVIAKVIRGKELCMVLEKANETLLYATDAVEKFSNRYCEGAFSMEY
ncbi:hypothetical protein LUZ63_002905 [Rhynchospora breviuscula]|uniref:CCZ1/INTU/HSP4 first Longin domain-containing protein n=1 Tax=Rhynchospora breviuscula TaxID=2022672 RepID=A0A9Q0CZM3_9POAL|nr:hypothetical protein LUZ63_002905 [Rhynchospora breviuscula]